MIEPMLMPYTGRYVPHGLIEVNQKCNISCTACYKDKFNLTKTLAEVKAEVDFMLSKRNLSLVTLAGGEPTLHPELDQIISYIKSKGPKVQILTNGFTLSEEELIRYRSAGLDKVYIHVDSMQKRNDIPTMKMGNEVELHPLRDRLGQLVRNSGLDCAHSFTIYRENFPQLKEMVRFIVQSEYYQRILVTICTDFSEIERQFGAPSVRATAEKAAKAAVMREKLEASGEFKSGTNRKDPKVKTGEEVTNQEIKEELFSVFGYLPFGYIGSTKSTKAQRWLLYYLMVITGANGQQEVINFDGRFARILKPINWISFKLTKKFPFGQVLNSRKAVFVTILYTLLLGNPREMIQNFRKLSSLLRAGSRIDQKSLVFQEGPRVHADGEIDYCRDCPDATIRNGVLTPVCTADILYPLTESESKKKDFPFPNSPHSSEAIL